MNGQSYPARGPQQRKVADPEEEKHSDDRRTSSLNLPTSAYNPLPAAKVTVTRSKDESKEDKKARKQAVKAERQGRRQEKKANKQSFTAEAKHQAKRVSAESEASKVRKL